MFAISFFDFLFQNKTSRILAMVTRLMNWSFGLDSRISVIERRLGAIEMALTSKGISVPEQKDEQTS